MILTLDQHTGTQAQDICIVGAGPVGIALALDCAKRGMKVLLLESGVAEPDDFHLGLGRGIITTPESHTPLEEANCRALGGTSHWWGGRCVPFDPVDFSERTWLPSTEWPIGYDDISPFYPAAAAFFGCGPDTFTLENPWPDLKNIKFDTLERWAPVPNMAARHAAALKDTPNITILLDATVTDLHFSDDKKRVTELTVTNTNKQMKITTPRIVLACGGVQTPRLLLAVQRRHPELFGGTDGPLGRFHMGHVFGKIAEVILKDPSRWTALDFFMHEGAFVRRRFTLPDDIQKQKQLLNISFSAGNARIADPEHRSGILSLIWLALASPAGKKLLPSALRQIYVGSGKRPYFAHILNLFRAPFSTMWEAWRVYADKYLSKPGKPGIFLRSAGGRYSLHYHSEQSPDPENRLSLSAEPDALGLPRIQIDFRYAEKDARAIVTAHAHIDEALRTSGIGRLEFHDTESERINSVLRQARDGMHQIGGARMSDNPATGVVDSDCKVHGIENLFIASSCVFPSSGQANPTFLAAALALRLAGHLTR